MLSLFRPSFEVVKEGRVLTLSNGWWYYHHSYHNPIKNQIIQVGKPEE
jgi:hypothetical protein